MTEYCYILTNLGASSYKILDILPLDVFQATIKSYHIDYAAICNLNKDSICFSSDKKFVMATLSNA